MKKLFSVTHVHSSIDLALLLARVGIGAFMLTHGIPKIAMLDANPVQFVDLFGVGPTLNLYLAIFAEVVCSILVIIGLGTRLAVIPLIFTMLVALLYVHSKDAFSIKEMAAHYLLSYVVLLLMGSGKYSVDNLLSNSNK